VTDQTAYQKAGVDTKAGDLAIELMRHDVLNTHKGRVIGGVGGFAGLFDAKVLKEYRHPVLATSTDGVGTKVAIAQALDKHDTIGQDLVAMVIDDIVVVGATPLFLTDYIAVGKVHPERIAAIVSGIARACEASNVAVVGGETAEHPGLLGEDEYDVAAAVTGVVEKDELLGPERVRAGDDVVAVASSGLHSNGYSLARHIITEAGISLHDPVPGITQTVGEVLLEPTLVYTPAMLRVLADLPGGTHSASHITGGGIAQNLQRVLPPGLALTLERDSWSVPPVFPWLAHQGGITLADVEDTWNLGMGLALVCEAGSSADVVASFEQSGHQAWIAGTVTEAHEGQVAEAAKGVSGGFVELRGSWG
jgi:phosphoribosylformylglycinamidine cyclo-ligase